MAIKQMYDIIEAGYQFTGVQKFDVGENPIVLPVRLFYKEEMVITHNGATILTDTDFSVTDIDSSLSDRFNKTVYKKLFILNPEYQSGMLTIDFIGVGDMMKSSDILDIKNEIDTKFAKIGGEIEGDITARNIIPNMVGGANGISLRNIGSQTQAFNSIYTKDIVSSSLYINSKKVLEDVSNTVEFKTLTDQGIKIKTTSSSPGSGSGNISLSSENMINIVGTGDINITTPANVSNKNITISTASPNGLVVLSSPSEIDITAPTIDLNGLVQVDSLVISGNLTVNGTTTTLNTQTLVMQDNIVELNSNQSGIPAASLISGIEINRGDSPNYRFIFKEDDDTFRIGEEGFEQAVASRQDTPVTNGVAFWNNTSRRFDTISTLTYSGSILNGTVSTANAVRGINFHADAVNPTGNTRLNMDGDFYATRVYNAVYNDLAEFMTKAEDAEPGMVLIMDGGKVKPCSKRGDAAVVGVYSDTYGYSLGADDMEDKLPIGISGRVDVWIEEPCKTGNLLITSEKRGFATVKKEGEDGQGKVFAKVLQDKNDSTAERVKVLILMA